MRIFVSARWPSIEDVAVLHLLVAELADLGVLLAVEPESDGLRVGAGGTHAVAGHPDDVLALDREPVDRVERGRHRQAGQVVVGDRVAFLAEKRVFARTIAIRVVADRRRLRNFRTVQGDARDLLRGRHVLLHQQRRQRQHVADGVEPEARIVLRKIVRRPERHAQQIANRVVVLAAVQAPGGDPPRFGDARRRCLLRDGRGRTIDQVRSAGPGPAGCRAERRACVSAPMANGSYRNAPVLNFSRLFPDRKAQMPARLTRYCWTMRATAIPNEGEVPD